MNVLYFICFVLFIAFVYSVFQVVMHDYKKKHPNKYEFVKPKGVCELNGEPVYIYMVCLSSGRVWYDTKHWDFMFGNEREIRRRADICDIKELKPFNEKLVY